jgi:hypothetical protein
MAGALPRRVSSAQPGQGLPPHVAALPRGGQTVAGGARPAGSGTTGWGVRGGPVSGVGGRGTRRVHSRSLAGGQRSRVARRPGPPRGPWWGPGRVQERRPWGPGGAPSLPGAVPGAVEPADPACDPLSHPRGGASRGCGAGARCRVCLLGGCGGVAGSPGGWGASQRWPGQAPGQAVRGCAAGAVAQAGPQERGGQGTSHREAWCPSRPEQAAASDGQKRPLRSRFWPRLSRSVRRLHCLGDGPAIQSGT